MHPRVKVRYITMQELEKLQDFEEIRGQLRLPPDTKPCIAELMKDCELRRSGISPFIIACELFRIGKKKEKVETVLLELGIAYSETQSAVKSASTGKYNYGCPWLEVEGLCLYENRTECWWYERIPKKSQKPCKERDFWRFGWPARLSSASGMVYLALREIEHIRRYKAGSRLYVSRKELAELAGISPPWAIASLENLEESGLISFEKGRQHSWYGKASTVRRVIPIPRPKVKHPTNEITKL